MQKIVYLFGAGASCKCLPLVKEIPDQFGSFIGFLEVNLLKVSDKEEFKEVENISKRELTSLLINDLKKLSNAIGSHDSIDVYAKKLYLKNEEEELKNLKLCMSAFFTFVQMTRGYDRRYDSFFASLLKEDSLDLPNNVRIISWNYDFQFELAFADFYHDKRVDSCSSVLNVVSKFSSDQVRPKKFSIFKLNGTASLTWGNYFYKNNFISDFNFVIEQGLDKIEEIVHNYSKGTRNRKVEPVLSFAWEREPDRYNISKQALAEIEDGKILVVIGYSFPFFNREIDRMLIGGMKELTKVYVQDISSKRIIERIKAIRTDYSNLEIVPYDDTEQFLLPDEL
jgi:hypothetical protein